MFRQSRENAASKKYYKQVLDADDMKKKREDNNFSVRKNKRQEQLRKKRQIGNMGPMGHVQEPKMSPHEIAQALSNLPNTVAQLQSQTPSERYSAVVALRKLLSIEKNPPIDQVIQAGAITPLVVVLNSDPDQNNQFEAAWALTNVASGSTEQTQILLRNKGAEAFIGKINPNAASLVKEQAVWAIGNIAGDSHACRDHLLHLGTMNLLLAETGENVKTSLRRNVVWSISNLCRGKPAPPFEAIKPAIPVLKGLLEASDTNVITDACWALSYITDGDEEYKVNEILRDGVCSYVVRLLNHKTNSVQTPALRVIGNIVTGDEMQTQAAISCGCLPALKIMLDSNTKKSTKREVCWTISNITAGSQQQIQAVLESGVIDSLIAHMHEAEFDVKKEAAWAIANATSSGSPEQIAELVQKGCIGPLCDLVSSPDVRVVAVSLEGLENILKNGEILVQRQITQINHFANAVEQCNGLKNIEGLVNHPSVPIYEKARNIIYQFFSDEDKSSQPISNDKSFEFSADQPQSGFSF